MAYALKVNIRFPDGQVIRNISLEILKEIPFFESLMNFDPPCQEDTEAELKKDIEIEANNELFYEPVNSIIQFLIAKENRFPINNVGTLRALRHTATYLQRVDVLEQFIVSEKEILSDTYFLKSGFPAQFIFQHYELTAANFKLAEKECYSLATLAAACGMDRLLSLDNYGHDNYEHPPMITGLLNRLIQEVPPELFCSIGLKREISTAYIPSMRNKGFPLSLLCNIFSLRSLIDAGVTWNDFETERVDLDVSKVATYCLAKAGYPLTKLREKGFRAQDLRAYPLDQFKAAGFPAQDLLSFINPKSLVEAGYSITELKEAHCTAWRLLNSDCSKQEIKASFTIVELKQERFRVHDLLKMGFSLTELEDVFTQEELKPIIGSTTTNSVSPSSPINTYQGTIFVNLPAELEPQRKQSMGSCVVM